MMIGDVYSFFLLTQCTSFSYLCLIFSIYAEFAHTVHTCYIFRGRLDPGCAVSHLVPSAASIIKTICCYSCIISNQTFFTTFIRTLSLRINSPYITLNHHDIYFCTRITTTQNELKPFTLPAVNWRVRRVGLRVGTASCDANGASQLMRTQRLVNTSISLFAGRGL